MTDAPDPHRLTLTWRRHGGKSPVILSFRPRWLWTGGLLLAVFLGLEGWALVTAARTSRRVRSLTGLSIEVDDLRRQNLRLRELDADLREILGFQQKMLRLAGIETALRRNPGLGDNFSELGTFDRPVLGGANRLILWPVDGERLRDFGPDHPGVDLRAAEGSAVLAAGSGRVTGSTRDDAWGVRLVLEHSDTLRTVYANAERSLVAVGDTVLAGQVIALAGAGFEGKEPHLHFEVRVRGDAVPPDGFIPALSAP
jgi:murein DD-endopeptidase MepM/ murein hydrolase activator NlpD